MSTDAFTHSKVNNGNCTEEQSNAWAERIEVTGLGLIPSENVCK